MEHHGLNMNYLKHYRDGEYERIGWREPGAHHPSVGGNVKPEPISAL